MAIDYTIRAEGDLLLVRAWGFDDSLEEVEAYGAAIIEAAVKHGVTKVLCLESELEYRLGTTETFRAASFVAEHAPHVGRVALVCAADSLGDARFWEDVTRNRGLQAAVFADAVEARRWLEEDAGRAQTGS
jgi:hypothetical protein